MFSNIVKTCVAVCSMFTAIVCFACGLCGRQHQSGADDAACFNRREAMRTVQEQAESRAFARQHPQVPTYADTPAGYYQNRGGFTPGVTPGYPSVYAGTSSGYYPGYYPQY